MWSSYNLVLFSSGRRFQLKDINLNLQIHSILSISPRRQSSGNSAPYCYICSSEEKARNYHHHMSSKELRVIQGIDKTDRPYMCHTCSRIHSAKPDGDLNVLVGTSQFHNIDTPRDAADATRKEPDPFHIDWDNREPARNHKNLSRDIKELNSWIVKFNTENGKQFTPRLHRFGVNDGWTLKDGKRTRIKKHIFFAVVKQVAAKQKNSSFLGNESETWNSCCNDGLSKGWNRLVVKPSHILKRNAVRTHQLVSRSSQAIRLILRASTATRNFLV